MKLRLLAASLAAMGVMAGSAFAAEVPLGDETFELYAAGDVITNMEAKAAAAEYCYPPAGDPDAFEIVGAWSSGPNDLSAMASDGGTLYLALDTEGDVVTNTIQSASDLSNILERNSPYDTELEVSNGEIFLKSTITFVPSDEIEDSLPEGSETDDNIDNGDLKFALYAYEHEVTEQVEVEGNPVDQTTLVTNLVVYHSFYDGDDVIFSNDVITAAINFNLEQEVTVTMKRPAGSDETFFKVAVASLGADVASPLGYATFEDAALNGAPNGGPWFRTVNNSASKAVGSINFSGTGSVAGLTVGYNTVSAGTTYSVDLTDCANVVVSNLTANTEIADISSPLDLEEGVQLGFYPTVGTITNVTVNTVEVPDPATPYVYTVTTVASQVVKVLAGEEPPAPTVITVTSVGNATVTDNQDGTYTITVPVGNGLSSVFVNGAAVDPALLTDNQDDTYTLDLSGLTTSANVVVATQKVRAPIGHKWYESPGIVGTNVYGTANDIRYYGPLHMSADGDFVAVPTWTAAAAHLDLFDLDDLITGEADELAEFDQNDYGYSFFGSGISEALNVVIAGSYSQPFVAALPLNNAAPVLGVDAFIISNSLDAVLNQFKFTSDGQYVYARCYSSNATTGADRNCIYKFRVLNGLKTTGVNLVDPVAYSVGQRVRSIELAQIGGNDILYAVAEDKTIWVINTSDTTPTATQLIPGFTASSSFINLAVTGVASGTPHLTIASADGTGRSISVYTLNATGTALAAGVEPIVFDTADITGWGVATDASYGADAVVTEDDETLLLGIASYVYAIQYVEPPVPTYTVDWTGSDKVSVTNLTDAASLDEVTSGDFTNGVQIAFYPTEGSITNILVAGEPQPVVSPFVLTVASDTNIVVLAGEAAQAEKPAWAADSGDGSDQDKYWAWETAHAAGQNLYAEGADFSAQYLLNVDANVTPTLHIDSIEITDEGTKIVVSAAAGNADIDLETINGVLDVYVGSAVGSLTKKSIPAKNLDFVTGKAEVIIPAQDGKFVKAGVDYSAPAAAITEISE